MIVSSDSPAACCSAGAGPPSPSAERRVTGSTQKLYSNVNVN